MRCEQDIVTSWLCISAASVATENTTQGICEEDTSTITFSSSPVELFGSSAASRLLSYK